MTNDDSATQRRDRTLRHLVENGTIGPEDVARAPVAPAPGRISAKDLGLTRSPQQVSPSIPVTHLLGNQEGRKTNEHLSELLALARSEAEEQRKIAEKEHRRANWSMAIALVTAGLAVGSLVTQILGG